MKAIRLTLLVLVALLAIGLSSCRKDEAPAPANGIHRDSLGSKTLKHVPTNPKKTLLDGLVAYYPFSGNANDESGNGYNGIVTGATLTTGKSGHKNSAYSFNGTSDLIDLPFSMGDSVTQFSVYGRFKSTSTGTLWDSGYEPGNYCTFKVTPTSVAYKEERTFFFHGIHNALQYGTAQGDISPGTPVEAWNDIVVNFDNGTLTVYVNGTLVNLTYQVFDDGIGRILPPYINGMRVGAHYNVKLAALFGIPYVDYFTGVIDEMRFYNRLLTPAEIDYLYRH